MKKSLKIFLGLLGITSIGAIAIGSVVSCSSSNNDSSNNNALKESNNFTTNEDISSYLSSLLSTDIDVANYENMSSYSAAQAVTTYNSELKQAILDAIQNQIVTKSGASFSFDNINLSINDIMQNIEITAIPASISLTNVENGEIVGISLSYNGMSLYSSNSSMFIVTGFKTITASEEFINQGIKIANELSKVLTTTINIGSYENINTYTASNALNQQKQGYSLLQNAVTNTIDSEIINNISFFVVNGVAYTEADITSNSSIKISFPSTISNIDNENAQIPNVQIYFQVYNDIQDYDYQLTSKTGSQNFTINGFKSPSATNNQSNSQTSVSSILQN
ncbi:hypothetical protein IKS57_05450 [bacterium]|nr:hypothetical protein [bacterium]